MVKHNRFFCTLALAAILSLLLVAITPTLALAAESLNFSPSSVEIGDDVTVSGSGYVAGDIVYIFISGEELDVDDDIEELENYYRTTTSAGALGAVDEGDIYKAFDMPDVLDDGEEDEDVRMGTYYAYATYSKTGDIVAMDEFAVRGIELDTTEGPVGTEVEIQGAGFSSNDDIELRYGSAILPIESGDEKTDGDGEFTCTAIIPESTAGDHTITAEDEANHEGEAEFTVTPEITISPTSGVVADEVTVSGTGFGDKVDVTITFGNTEVATDETDKYGSFEADFNVPTVGPGTYDVTAEDEDDNSASAEFTMTMYVSISPTTSGASPGYVGMEVTISGTGFRANHQITITYASTPVVFTTTSLADGSFTYTFAVPPSPGGSHTITATDGTNSMPVTFIMESTPPQTPQPLLPYMGDKADSKAYFDWEDVTDPSLPVTYEFQIATDANFTNKLVNKTGLTTSEYTLTEEEALESTSEEAPYYWRVRAVDSASNASAWTGAGTFHVGFIFAFPELEGWVLYAVIGAGALLVFFLGFWLGRRGGGEYY